MTTLNAGRPRATGDAIHLVFITDENFVKYTGVTLASVLRAETSDRPIVVYLLSGAPLGAERLEALAALAAIRRFELHNIVVEARQFDGLRTTPGIPVSTYYRLLIHDLLPADVTRALYLDSDLIFCDAVSKLVDLDMGGALFAGVEDSRSQTYKRKHGQPPQARHINAGVYLSDLTKMRRLPFSDIVRDFVEAHRYTITLGDQEIINSAFPDDVSYLPLRWNLHGALFDPAWAAANFGVENTLTAREWEAATANPAVIHYTYTRKPWMSLKHPRARDWWAVAVETPFFTSDDVARLEAQEVARAQGGAADAPFVKRSRWSLMREYFARQVSAPALFARMFGGQNALAQRLRALEIRSGRGGESVLRLLSLMALRDNAARIGERDFVAEDFVRSLPEHARIYTNAEVKDLEGGFHTNLKPLFRTADLGRHVDLFRADFLLAMVQRPGQSEYWNLLNYSVELGQDLYFGEATFFGAMGSYFDEDLPPILRRAFGYVFDDLCFFFDARVPSRLERFLNSAAAALDADGVARADRLIGRIVEQGITKYNLSSTPPMSRQMEPGGVLVILQKPNDASIQFGGASKTTFDDMVAAALSENPDQRIYVKTHPDNPLGDPSLVHDRIEVLPAQVDICALLDQCAKVYVVTSQVGFEAVLRDKEVHVFGQPFYAGWGLTQDRRPITRRTATRSRQELFAAACLRHSVYLDPETGDIVSMEAAMDKLIALRDQYRAR